MIPPSKKYGLQIHGTLECTLPLEKDLTVCKYLFRMKIIESLHFMIIPFPRGNSDDYLGARASDVELNYSSQGAA